MTRNASEKNVEGGGTNVLSATSNVEGGGTNVLSATSNVEGGGTNVLSATSNVLNATLGVKIGGVVVVGGGVFVLFRPAGDGGQPARTGRPPALVK